MRTGRCCAAFPLPSDPEPQIVAMVVPLSPEDALARLATFGVPGPFTEPLYTCVHWDEETGRCRDYDRRPSFCRDRRRRADGLCAAGTSDAPPCILYRSGVST